MSTKQSIEMLRETLMTIQGIQSITLHPRTYLEVEFELERRSDSLFEKVNPRPLQKQFKFCGVTIIKGEYRDFHSKK